MKSRTSLLLLITGFSFLRTTTADVSNVSVKLKDELPEMPPSVWEQEIIGHDINVYKIQKLQKTPLEISNEVFKNRTAAAAATAAAATADGAFGECRINIRSGLTDPQPVFLENDVAAFYPFTENGLMHVISGKRMQMFCPGKFKKFKKNLITATCVNGIMFRVNGTSYKFSEFVCKTWPDFMVKKTGRRCSGGGVLLKVGFEISSFRFVEQMQVCFNEEEEVTNYVYHTLQPGSNYYQTSVERITFQNAGFFGNKNVDKLYSQKSQQETINIDLGGNAHKYFNNTKNIYLARGHLGAKADLIYGSQQRATFIFINAAPQWQVFNSGNWARIEDGIRSWVSKNKIHVQCYTGVYGVTTLPNINGYETPLYLAHDENNNGLIPVPKLYFRVVLQPATRKGIVFVGVNNPHLSLKQIKEEYIICKDVGDKVNYINWRKTDLTAGYSYACKVADFLKTVKTLPNISANGGLLV